MTIRRLLWWALPARGIKPKEWENAVRAVVGDELMPKVRQVVYDALARSDPWLNDPAETALTFCKAGMTVDQLPMALDAVRAISRDYGYGNDRVTDYVAAVHAITGGSPHSAVVVLRHTKALLEP